MRKHNGRTKFHASGLGRDGSTGRRRRNDAEEQIDLAAPPTRQVGWLQALEARRVEAELRRPPQAKAGDESLDGVHSLEAAQVADDAT